VMWARREQPNRRQSTVFAIIYYLNSKLLVKQFRSPFFPLIVSWFGLLTSSVMNRLNYEQSVKTGSLAVLTGSILAGRRSKG